MLGIPRTPKRVVRAHSRDIYQPRFRIDQPASPLPKSDLQGFILPLKQPILGSMDLPTPIRMNTSTPKPQPTHHSPLFKEPPKRRSELQHQNANALPKIVDVDEEELHEEVALEDSDVIVLSPEPRPVSAPLIKKALPKPPPRPRTAEPIEQKPAKIAVRKPAIKQRTVPKLTVTQTPRCARPTASWLARIKSNREDCTLKAPIS
ncbi:unnamed protein product [Caenorhabditis nigoni]